MSKAMMWTGIALIVALAFVITMAVIEGTKFERECEAQGGTAVAEEIAENVWTMYCA